MQAAFWYSIQFQIAFYCTAPLIYKSVFGGNHRPDNIYHKSMTCTQIKYVDGKPLRYMVSRCSLLCGI